MPNHCTNTLKISGPYEDIKRLIDGWNPEENVDQWGSLSGLLKTYLPFPEVFNRLQSNGEKYQITDESKVENDEYIPDAREYRDFKDGEALEIIQKYGTLNWYDWCIQNWGSKWGDYDGYMEDLEEGDSEIYYSHSSAWAPLNKGWRRLSELFPTLLFYNEYYEGGMNFRGRFQCDGGVVTIDESWDMTAEDAADLFDMTPDEWEHGEEYCIDGVYVGEERETEINAEHKASWEKRKAELDAEKLQQLEKGGDNAQ